MQAAAEALLVFALAYATAFGETLTIAHFPYYTFKVGAQALGGPFFFSTCFLWGTVCQNAPTARALALRDSAPPRTLPPILCAPHQDCSAVVPTPLQDRSRMYSVGSLFYAIYFFVSFPMFYRMDEQPRVRVAGTALGARSGFQCPP